MDVHETALGGVLELTPVVYEDDRGFFFESWNQQRFDEAVGRPVTFAQDNHSRSAEGVLRGLHYQVGRPQGKLIRVVAGSVLDVAVDLRKSSSTFLQWVSVELTAENRKQLWIPEGFAHGFVVTSPATEVLYKTTTLYHHPGDRSVAWDDPDIAVDWQLTSPPILSAKDIKAPKVSAADLFD